MLVHGNFSSAVCGQIGNRARGHYEHVSFFWVKRFRVEAWVGGVGQIIPLVFMAVTIVLWFTEITVTRFRGTHYGILVVVSL
jgi:hypothetical protein